GPKEKMTASARSRRHRSLRLCDERNDEAMILKVLADARQVAAHGDPVAAKLVGLADARQHEQAGRLDDSGAQNRFLLGPDVMRLAPNLQPHACATTRLERERANARAG